MNLPLFVGLLVASMMLILVAAFGFWQTDRLQQKGHAADVAMGPGLVGTACLIMLFCLWFLAGVGALAYWVGHHL